MKRAIMWCLLSIMTLSCVAKDKETINITPVAQDADAANGGIIYALPQTVVRVTLRARAVVATAGPFFQYSGRYLDIKDGIVTANTVKWQVIGAEVSTTGRADLQQRYKISTTNVGSMPMVDTDEDGKILALGTQAPHPATEKKQELTILPKSADMSHISVPGSVLTRTSTASRAEECAQVIYSLRESRIDLISGAKEAQLPDAGALATALARLDKEEADLVSLFAGRRDTFYVSKTIEIVPDYSGSNSNVPIRFSETSGFVDALDLSGKPVYVDFEFDDNTRINAYAEGSKQRKAKPIGGLRYYIPSNLTVRVLDRNILLNEAHVRCSQNAQMASLPAEILQTHKIVFDEATGGISSLSPRETTNNQKKTKE